MSGRTLIQFLREVESVNHDAIDAWGVYPEVLMVMEESGELLDTFAKHMRGRATSEDVVDEAADQILVACLAVTLSDGHAEGLEDALLRKLERTGNRVAMAEGAP